ncbi:unnamed protein product [Rotaria magnacalcarata]|uniref:Helix-turn-helix domain-containing protein n=1 Tax=Rotaria magnacalcarata TaxID=392030 RepID=A0A819Z0W0_9BILA|nr:unnamed protein product [Rotaria magnacalcarata]
MKTSSDQVKTLHTQEDSRIITARSNAAPFKITVIHAYAPTSASSDEEIDVFYNDIEDALSKIHSKDIIIVTGDWNAKVDSDNNDWKQVMGRYCYGDRNERGERLLEFATTHSLYICNTKFQQKPQHPRFIYNDPKVASRQRTTELAVLKRKIANRFFEKKVNLGKAVEQFIAELDSLLKNLHDAPARKATRQHEQQREIISYDNLLQTIHLNQCQITKCSISTGKKKNYPRLVKWLKQKLRSASIIFHLVKLAHLYYLPNAHKPGTPLRPIVSELKHPTIKISKFLDGLLRPLFDGMASNTTVTPGFEVIKLLQEWSKHYLNIKQIDGLKIEAIIRLCRFGIQNNYFSCNGKYYHQVRGGAMNIVTQISNSNGLYIRYIDDIIITINWPTQHLSKQIDQWNKFDANIKLKTQIGYTTNFLDLKIENKNGVLFTEVYHKPSYESYYFPFNSIHPIHMKKHIPFEMLIRAIKYCSTFEAYLYEREKLRMALLLNKYPGEFLEKQFNHVFQKYDINQSISNKNYSALREKIVYADKKAKITIDYNKTMFVHFTYYLNMKAFPVKFHTLWNKYFIESPINEIKPVLGTRNVKNLQQQLIRNKNEN